jgi:hypothetical protein
MAKRCVVKVHGRRCPNTARPGSRSCGGHGKKRASRSAGGSPRLVHLDCSIPVVNFTLDPTQPDDDGSIETRGNAIVGLPTNKPQMIAFLRNWLARHAGNLDLLERLTPAVLTPAPLMANAYCQAAEQLVRYDLGGGAAC